MWIVTVYDTSRDESIDVIVHDFDELIKIMNYVKDNDDLLFLNHVEERWMTCGLEGLKDIVGDNESNDIPDKI